MKKNFRTFFISLFVETNNNNHIMIAHCVFRTIGFNFFSYKLDKNDTFCGAFDEEFWEEKSEKKALPATSPQRKPVK